MTTRTDVTTQATAYLTSAYGPLFDIAASRQAAAAIADIVTARDGLLETLQRLADEAEAAAATDTADHREHLGRLATELRTLLGTKTLTTSPR